MIFGHGVDPDLGDRIRVTVIATGFQAEKSHVPASKKDDKKVHDLDRSQGWLFNAADNSVNEKKDLELRNKIEREAEREREEEKSSPRELTFTGPFNRAEDTNHKEEEGRRWTFCRR